MLKFLNWKNIGCYKVWKFMGVLCTGMKVYESIYSEIETSLDRCQSFLGLSATILIYTTVNWK